MTCLRCGNELGVNQRICLRCGFVVPTSSPTEMVAGGRGIKREGVQPGGAASLSEDRLLSRGRYSRIEQCWHQRWSDSMYETYWRACDMQQGAKNVMIGEVRLSSMKVAARQACLRAAMKAFFVAGTQPHVPALLDVFRDGNDEFFVFEAVEGESLLARMQRTGQVLPEQDVVEFCLQITNILEALFQQQPPLVHGFISPESVVYARNGQWFLINFSLILACNLSQALIDLDQSLFPPFIAPELREGMIDDRADMYSLLATAYYAVTGEPMRGQGVSARISPALGRIFRKGLHPVANQRYQRPSELYQDLQALLPKADISVSTNMQGPGRSAPLFRSGWEERASVVSTPLSGDRQEEQMRTRSVPLSGNRQEEQMRTRSAPLSGNRQEERAAIMTQQAWQESQPPAPSTPTTPPASTAMNLASLMLASEPEMPAQTLLPRPEELPPMRTGNDRLTVLLWVAALLICFLIILLVGQ
jgi:serine/threonine protein kinase